MKGGCRCLANRVLRESQYRTLHPSISETAARAGAINQEVAWCGSIPRVSAWPGGASAHWGNPPPGPPINPLMSGDGTPDPSSTLGYFFGSTAKGWVGYLVRPGKMVSEFDSHSAAGIRGLILGTWQWASVIAEGRVCRSIRQSPLCKQAFTSDNGVDIPGKTG